MIHFCDLGQCDLCFKNDDENNNYDIDYESIIRDKSISIDNYCNEKYLKSNIFEISEDCSKNKNKSCIGDISKNSENLNKIIVKKSDIKNYKEKEKIIIFKKKSLSNKNFDLNDSVILKKLEDPLSFQLSSSSSDSKKIKNDDCIDF